MSAEFLHSLALPSGRRRRGAAFSEVSAWRPVGAGWRPLQGSFHELGFSVEWHDFTPRQDLDWAPTFHADGLEICLNLAGRGVVETPGHRLEFDLRTSGFYAQTTARLRGLRTGGERHQFITIELSLDFITRQLKPAVGGLHPLLKAIMAGRLAAGVSESGPLTMEHQQLVASLQRPPVHCAAQRMWYQAKALEVAATFFYTPAGEEELFCKRQQRINHERALKVAALLKENLVEPPSLEVIGQRIGCSHFYLSRIFSQEMGCGIFQYLRDLRLERAAELLRAGRHNVTEAAMEMGYSSLSHFSQAFRERFGCCPGLYPVQTPAQRAGPAHCE